MQHLFLTCLVIGNLFTMQAIADSAPIQLTMTVFEKVTTTDSQGKSQTQLIEAISVTPDDTVVYVTEYKNSGHQTINNVTITVPIPEHLIYIRNSATKQHDSNHLPVTFSVNQGRITTTLNDNNFFAGNTTPFTISLINDEVNALENGVLTLNLADYLSLNINHPYATLISQATLNERTQGVLQLFQYSADSDATPMSIQPTEFKQNDGTLSPFRLRFFGSNQSIPPLNNGYDTDIELSANNTIVTQTGPITLNSGYSLLIRGDSFANRTVSYHTNGFDLNIGGSLVIGAGGDTALKELNISNSTVTVGQDFEVRTGANNLISTNSIVILNGSGAQTVTMNGKAMDSLTLNNTSTAGVIFNDAFTANTVTNSTPNSTMTFAAGQNFTVNNAINLQGASGQPINLRSSIPGTYWNFILGAGASKTIDYVNVTWSDASGSHSTQKPINPTNASNSGSNIDWFTTLSVSKTSTLISDPINLTGFNKSHIPGAIVEYNITVQNPGTNSPDSGTVTLNDTLDSNVEYDVAAGVVFSAGTSGLSLGTIRYSHINSPSLYTYTPTAPFDPNVAGIKIETNGTFSFGGSPPPEFSVTYRVRVK